jgi:hypothetical protein
MFAALDPVESLPTVRIRILVHDISASRNLYRGELGRIDFQQKLNQSGIRFWGAEYYLLEDVLKVNTDIIKAIAHRDR